MIKMTTLGQSINLPLPTKPAVVAVKKVVATTAGSSSKPIKKVKQPKVKKPESTMGARIRQLQEEKRKREEEEEKRAVEEAALIQLALLEEEKKLREKREKIKIQKAKDAEHDTKQQLQQKQAQHIQQASLKYGYTPAILLKNTIKPVRTTPPSTDVPLAPINTKVINEVINTVVNDVLNDKESAESDWDVDSDNDYIHDHMPYDIKDVMEPIMEPILDDLRAPIICILGQIDAGKTHLLDYIRSSVVYKSEAGGITQQISASYVPIDHKLKGLIFLDTPGHEPFVNMRHRGTALCDIAVLMVDIMVGVTEQTIQCLKLLNKPFVIAINKVDLLYGWKSIKNNAIKDSLKLQDQFVLMEYNDRIRQIWVQFQELGYNTSMYWENVDNINMVPISAMTGEGICDLLTLLADLLYLVKSDIVDCTVLEVNETKGRGTTIDVILINGTLNINDQIVVGGLNGPIVTHIKALLTHSYTNRKGEYINTNKVTGSMTCKIDASHLDDVISGSPLFVIKPTDTEKDIENYKKQVMYTMTSLKNKITEGVYVVSQSLGTVEAIVEHLHQNNIGIGGFSIGNVCKKDITKANQCLLAFDVIVDDEVKKYAESVGVKIFEHNIIYKLFESFTTYLNEIKKLEQEALSIKAVFPCILSILPECIFNKKSPIIIGVKVVKGILKSGTPLCYYDKQEMVEIGVISSMEKNHKQVDKAVVGEEVCVNIKDNQPSFGRHFNENNKLYSKIDRESIDALKTLHPDMVVKKDIFKLLVKLKEMFNII